MGIMGLQQSQGAKHQARSTHSIEFNHYLLEKVVYHAPEPTLVQ